MTATFRTHDGRTLQQAASDLVAREVLCCMSSMVSTLATGFGNIDSHKGRGPGAMIDLAGLAEQAFELAAPVLDYEEAAREASWAAEAGGTWRRIVKNETGTAAPELLDRVASAEAACEMDNIEPYEWEVFEHWAVSTWLAEKLEAAGERVDTDFAGLNVWARTTTGQAISIDAVIERITHEMHATA